MQHEISDLTPNLTPTGAHSPNRRMGSALNPEHLKLMNGRITAIDALRGLDMLLLCGGATTLQLLLQHTVGNEAPAWLMLQFTHAEWGKDFTCWDLVMPLFIFITGASMPFAFQKYKTKGGNHWRRKTTPRIIRRVLLLFLLGMLVQGNLTSADTEHMSLFCNTLQAIAEGSLIAAIILMFFSLRGQITACAFCLIAYWALLRFMPYNGQPAGLFEPHNNLAIYIDHKLQGSWQDGTPYTWILTAFSFGALTLMGCICGELIRLYKGHKAILIMLLTGSTALLAACMLEQDTPLIKHIYTTTAVLWGGGWCIILLAIFHLLFDCSGPYLAKCTLPLQVFGCNALLAYLLTEIHGPHGHNIWWGVVHPLIYGLADKFHNATEFAHAGLSLLLLWLFLFYLFKRKIFLRV